MILGRPQSASLSLRTTEASVPVTITRAVLSPASSSPVWAKLCAQWIFSLSYSLSLSLFLSWFLTLSPTPNSSFLTHTHSLPSTAGEESRAEACSVLSRLHTHTHTQSPLSSSRIATDCSLQLPLSRSPSPLVLISFPLAETLALALPFQASRDYSLPRSLSRTPSLTRTHTE